MNLKGPPGWQGQEGLKGRDGAFFKGQKGDLGYRGPPGPEGVLCDRREPDCFKCPVGDVGDQVKLLEALKLKCESRAI